MKIQTITFWKRIAKQVSSHGHSPNVRPVASQRLVIYNNVHYWIDLILNVFAHKNLFRWMLSAFNPFQEVNKKVKKNEFQFEMLFQMAEAGFYWYGTMQENDAAACFLCGKVLDGWESTDDPWFEHRKHSPQCAFVKHGRPEDDLTVS